MINSLPAETVFLNELSERQIRFYYKCMKDFGFTDTPFAIDIRSTACDLFKLQKIATNRLLQLTSDYPKITDHILPLNIEYRALAELTGTMPLGHYCKESIHKFHNAIGYLAFVHIKAANIENLAAQKEYLEHAQQPLRQFLMMVLDFPFDKMQQQLDAIIYENQFSKNGVTSLAGGPGIG